MVTAERLSVRQLAGFLPKQEVALDALYRCKYILYGGAAGPGKLIPLDTPVPTPAGWSSMGALCAGDEVFDERGHRTTVTMAHAPETPRNAYRLCFDDGSTIDAGEEHLWVTFDAKELASLTKRDPEWRARRREKRPSRATGLRSLAFTQAITARNRVLTPPILDRPAGTVRTTREIAETLRTHTGRANHAVPVAGALELPHADLPLDPYLLGLWLGDGSKSGGSITTMDPEIEAAFAAGGFPPGRRQVRLGNQAWSFTARGVVGCLRALGVLGDKHVPLPYLRGSQEQRLSLLRGLMDTDGTADRRGDVSFTNTNRRIVDAVHELVVSLGWKASVTEGRARYRGRDYGPVWDVAFSAADYVFRLARKRERQRLTTRRTTRFRYIVAANPIDSVPMRCISVDSPSRLYLAGRQMVPTHNSYWLRWAALHFLVECAAAGLTGVRVGLFCEDYPTLRDRQISRIKREFPLWLGEIKETRDEGLGFHLEPRWGSGFIALRNLDDPSKYASTEFAAEFVDELTKNDRQMFDDLRFRLRWPGLEHTPFAAATNPGSKGHAWVKKLFVDRDFSGDDAMLNPEDFAFIQALPRDNPYLGLSYWAQLDSLPPRMREALRDGRWDVFEGQAFPEFNRAVHVVRPYTIPVSWTRWTSTDYGFVDPWCTLWHARSPDRLRVVTYREVYQRRVPPREQARAILAMSEGERIQLHAADPSMWAQRNKLSPDSVADEYAMEGLRLSPANNDRLGGKALVHEALAVERDAGGLVSPRWQIFDTCTNLIRTMESIPVSTTRPEDVDTEADDHAYDSARYGFSVERQSAAATGMVEMQIAGAKPVEPRGLQERILLRRSEREMAQTRGLGVRKV